MFGDGDSGERLLENSLKNFERDQTDVFGFDCVDLGDLKKIIIRHDNSGLAAGWFLDKVVIESGKGERWFFLCGQWLADDEEDKLISRELPAVKDDSTTYAPLITYRVEVITGDRHGAGTDAQVSIELYGENSKSGMRVLDNSQNNFERNKTDVFGIETVDIGKISRISIGHDNSGFGAPWFLDKIIVTSQKTQEQWYFLCGDWFEGSQNRREIIASDKDGNPSLPLVSYKIEVTTGDRKGAGTDANVHIVVYGANGDSGVRPLDGPGNKFERKQKDVFGFKTVDLGEIQKIRIGHDNSGFGAAWFLDKVVITNENTKKTWFFLCGKWFAKDEEDGAIEREIAASGEDGVASTPLVTYKVLVTTGDRRGAGTDANVLLTLFGSSGDSGERKLEAPGNNFERDSTDIFGFDCVDLGEIQRIIVRHDNSGVGPGWFLDKVVIESGKGERWFFPCGQWLADDEGDKQISREIAAVKEDIPSYAPLITYRIEVLTGDRQGAGTDANVSVELYGENGKSGINVLDNSQNNFERNQTDVFGIESVDLGKLVKLNIGHDNSGFGPAWFLDKVIVINQKTQERMYFLCGDWLQGSQNRREIPASETDSVCSLPLVPYKIEVYTGDRRGAGTDSNVHIVLYGPNSDSGVRLLEAPGNLFERKKVDNFGLTAVDLGDLQKIRIGHDNTGFGPNWFLEKVIVTNDRTGQKWHFLCGMWLSKDQDDGAIEREIPALPKDGQACLPLTTYTVKVLTGDRRGAGTDANVFITIFGTTGDSGERILDNSLNNFERNQTDAFGVQCIDLGDIQRIIIRHDNSGPASAWFLDKVIIESGKGDRWFFPCGKWLSLDMDDKKLSRDILAVKEDNPTYPPLVSYRVTVYTGDRPGAGTNGTVYLTLIGENGLNSPEQRLEGGLSDFQRAKEDIFGLQLVHLGPLTKIRVRLDSQSPLTTPWFLDKIFVHSEKDNRTSYFLHGDWLDRKNPIKELPASSADGRTHLPMVTYKVHVTTGSCRGAGTDANVFVVLYGGNGDSGRRPLDGPIYQFERGRTDSFALECVELGELSKIRIGHDGVGIGSGWFCEGVVVESSVGTKWNFPCRMWFDSKEGDRQIERDLYVNGKPGLPICRYRISVITGKDRGAGTDANVFITLIGTTGTLTKARLDNEKDNFESGRIDVFWLEIQDLGELKQAIIGHDDKGFCSAWFCDKIFILNETTGQRWTLPCKAWFDKTQGDRKIERTLVPSASAGTTYVVQVYTGNVKDAGTDANVHIVITGKKGKTGVVKLDKSENTNMFEQGQVDTIPVDAPDLGELVTITIGHDNSGLFGAEWFLDRVVIVDQATGATFLFPCNQWFDKSKGDKLIERTLKVATK